jgi:hypothetical protein
MNIKCIDDLKNKVDLKTKTGNMIDFKREYYQS